MKKVLAFVLTLAMVLGCFSSVFAASYTDVKTTDDFATAVSVLSDLGVVSGYTDGTYQPAKVVTRAEMAALIVKALGLTPAASATTVFSDVPASHWASGYVAYANSLGIIAGYTDGTFKPSKTVSYDEAITMIVSALGYTPDSLEGNTWPAAYVMKADILGITEDVTVLGSAGANRGDVAIMLYNTLGVQIGKTNKDGDWVGLETKTEKKDCMLERLGAECDGEEYIVGLDITAENSTIDMAEYFGAVVTAYTDGDDFIAVNEVVTEFVTMDDFDPDDFTSNWDVADETQAFVNGVAVGDFTKTDFTKLEEEAKVAVVKSGSKIKTVYTVQAWEADDTLRIADVEDYLEELEDEMTIAGTYEFVMDEEDDEVIDTKSFILVGADSLEAIAEDSVLTFYVYPTGDNAGKVAKIEVSTKTVEGSVDKFKSDKWTIDGTAYELAEFYAYTPTLGDEGTFYFDYAGNLFDYEKSEDAEADWLYGVIFAFGDEEGRYGTDRYFAKMYTADGIKEFEFADKDTYDDADYGLVAYTLDDDGMIDDVDYEEWAEITADAEVSKKGVVSGMVIADDAIIFVNTTDSADDDYEDDFTVAKKADYLGKTISAAEYFYNDDNEIVAAFITDAEDEGEDDKVLAIVTDITKLSSDKYDYDFEIEALYAGEAKTFYTDATTAEVYTTAAAISGEYVTFKLNADGAITEIVPVDSALTEAAGTLVTGNGVTVTVSGSVLKIGTTAYTLEDEVTVYVSDDDEWSVGKLASSYKATAYDKIVLFDLDSTPDKEFDVVFIIK